MLSSLSFLLAAFGPLGTVELLILAMVVAIPIGIVILVKSWGKK